MMLHQLHWQYRDGSTEMRAQRDINNLSEMGLFIKEIKKTHPLPHGAVWMACNENSKDFVLAKEVA